MSAPEMYLTRARLRDDVPAAALRAVLVPAADAERVATTHRLVWTLFADSPDRTRDFLWREAEPGLFYLLSARRPEDRHGLFAVDPPKPFAPEFREGDHLAFALRANATVARHDAESVVERGTRGTRRDVVMDAIHNVARDKRAGVRVAVLESVAREWLEKQGARCGFALAASTSDVDHDDEDDEATAQTCGTVRVLGYQAMRIERGPKRAPMRLGVLDLEGALEVRQPALFVESLRLGFGRAKAFGCGLMLVRRAPAWA